MTVQIWVWYFVMVIVWEIGQSLEQIRRIEHNALSAIAQQL